MGMTTVALGLIVLTLVAGCLLWTLLLHFEEFYPTAKDGIEREFPFTGYVVTPQRERLRLARQRNSRGNITVSIEREVINDPSITRWNLRRYRLVGMLSP
jgi:hypothetical protein